MKYILHYKDKDKFYASYGSFIHKIIELYYKRLIQKEDMAAVFLDGFKDSVKGRRPKKELVEKYITAGADYFRNFEPFPFQTINVEKEVKFELDGIPFIGYIGLRRRVVPERKLIKGFKTSSHARQISRKKAVPDIILFRTVPSPANPFLRSY